ncbi:MAG: M20 family metallo-hydrolase [Deltaproteobacteria bacterium]|nr:M20 family metallo-hydrolase [Deltaproteobacteria bacterium]
MAKNALQKELAKRIDGYRDEMIELQKKLSAIQALSPASGGEGEGKKADFLIEYLKGMKFSSIERLDAPDPACPGGRPNVIARFKGKDSSRTIWVMSHLDVVPPGDPKLWTGDPWTVRPGKDAAGRDTLIGRGVEDNQQGVVSGIFAAKALMELPTVPAHDVALIFVADEETGSRWGIQWVLQEHAGLFRKEDLIIVPDAGDAHGTMIEVAEKSICWVKFEVKGKQVHASMPEKGVNAHLAASHLIVKLHKRLKAQFKEKDKVFDPPISTFEPTKKDANVPNINTIPGEDIFYFDCRVLPTRTLDEVITAVREECDAVEKDRGVKVTFDYPQKEQAAPATPVDAPVVLALQRAVKDVYNKKARPMGIGGGTVAAVFRRAGFNAAVWATMDEAAHQPDEYCVIDNMLGDAKVFAHVFTQESA